LIPDFSVSMGAGGSFTYNFSHYFEKYTVNYTPTRIREENHGNWAPSMTYGGFVFIDFTYAELDIGFGRYSLSPTGALRGLFTGVPDKDINGASIDLGLMVKWPFGITKEFSIYPMLGGSVQIPLSSDEEIPSYSKFDIYAAVWGRAGVGADISLTDRIYLRAQILYGVRSKTIMEEEADDLRETQLENDYPTTAPHEEVELDWETFDHGPQVKLGVGFRF
jgi:hypothetical protein